MLPPEARYSGGVRRTTTKDLSHLSFSADHTPPHENQRVLIAAFGGWSDAGSAATTAIEHLESSLDVEPLHAIGGESYVDLQMYRPMLTTQADGSRTIEWPDSRLLGPIARPGVAPIDENDPPTETVRTLMGETVSNIFLFEGTEPAHHWQSYADEIVDLVETWGIDLVVLLGSMFSDAPHSRPLLISVTTENPEVRARFDAERGSYEGPIGITTVLSQALDEAGIDTLSLWAQVPHYVHSAPSPKATLALLDRCEELLNIVIPRGDLLSDATEWEQNIDALAGQDEEMIRYIQRLEEARDSVEGPEATGDAIAYELEKFLQIRPDDTSEEQ